ncbi:MAG TPA: regulatory protein RecX, partial [Candidatus Absconditabacterales bacterium]|nr:regulatory protein RecX [Candidatus Absconditabacterales bacterium]
MASATEYSLKYINLYPKTEKELRAKLMEKHYGEEEIEKTITYLKRKNYVNDELYCELYINSQLIKKGKPLYAVKQKLLQKGVDKTLVNKSL